MQVKVIDSMYTVQQLPAKKVEVTGGAVHRWSSLKLGFSLVLNEALLALTPTLVCMHYKCLVIKRSNKFLNKNGHFLS